MAILVINLLDGLLMLHVTFCLIPCCSDCGRGWTVPGQTVWKIRSLYMVANITRPLESEIQPEMDFLADKTDTISATMLGIYYKGPCKRPSQGRWRKDICIFIMWISMCSSVIITSCRVFPCIHVQSMAKHISSIYGFAAILQVSVLQVRSHCSYTVGKGSLTWFLVILLN